MKNLLTWLVTMSASAQLTLGAVVSLPSSPGVSAAGNSFNPVFSADGQHLVFVSHANNLVTNDDLGPWLDVFVRDLVSSNTVLVSVSTNGIGGGNWDANCPSISSNGQFVAFASRASNLVPGDTNDAVDVYLRDVSAGLTRLVSVDVNGNAAIDPAPSSIIPLAGKPMISGDGRWIFFESRATNLVAGGAPLGSVNIYARDTRSNLTVLVSTTATGNAAGGKCELAGLAADGGTVAFITTNTAIVAGVSNTGAEVYVRQLQPPFTIWASSNAAATVGFPYSCGGAALNADGRYAAFSAGGATNFVFRRDLLTGVLTPLNLSSNVGSSGIQISDDGTRVLFDFNNRVHVWRQEVGTVSRINLCDMCCGGGGGSVDGPDLTYNGYLSADGRYVAFRSSCDNTLAYRRDLVTDANNSLVVPTTGASLDAYPVLSPSGGIAAFHHSANNLTSDDHNGASDIFLRDPDQGVTELISKAQPAKPVITASTHSFLSLNSFSADGRFVISRRYDDPSARNDTNGWRDVFVTDLWSNRVVAVSVNTNGLDNTNNFERPVISADGSTIASLRSGWPGGNGHIGVAHRTTGITTNYIGGGTNVLETNFFFTGGSMSYAVEGDSIALSSDGRLLAFDTDAAYCGPWFCDGSGTRDILLRYWFQRPDGTLAPSNHLVSSTLDPYYSGNGDSVAPVITGDGGVIAFATKAGNLLEAGAGPGGGRYGNWQIVAAHLGTNRSATNYLHAMPKRLVSYSSFTTQTFVWIDAYDTNSIHTNVNWFPVPLTTDVSNTVVSADGHFLFHALADGSAIYRHDLRATHTNIVFVRYEPAPPYAVVRSNLVAGALNTLACTNCRTLSVSADGNVIAFERPRAGSSSVEVYVSDLRSGEETLVNVTPTDSPSPSAVLSADGRYVVFQSRAANLVANDTNTFTDVFVRDRLLGVTMLASATAQGLPANGPSTHPVIAPDSRSVAFQSLADNLIAADYNDRRDLFVLKLGGADTDGDGMDDDWEVAYFDDLSRDGSGDFDFDGATDLQEFFAGTDPKNAGSIFRVLTVSPSGGGSKLLFWMGNPTLSYRAEFKDDLGAASWTALMGTISWNGSTASIVDSTAANSAHRYYRVRRLP